MSVSNGATTVSYDYDAEGQLVRRKTNGVVDRYFLWDNGQLVAELDSSAATKRNEFAYQPGVDQPLARIPNGGSIQFFQLDGRGNVAGLASGTTAIQSLRFGPWGDVERQVGDSLADTRLGWKGLLWDGGVSSLYYVRARWYDPQSRSFLSEDPAGLSGGPNTYAFAGNDPVNGQDPAGMSEENCTIIWGFWYNPDTGVIDPGSPFILNSWCDGGGGSQGGAPTPTTPVAGGGGGAAASQNSTVKKVVSKACGLLPDGRAVGVRGGIGGVASVVGGYEAVYNYNSGVLSVFLSGGGQAGWNGAFSGSVSGGYVYGLMNDNSNYSGGFSGASFEFGAGAYAMWSSGGMTGSAANGKSVLEVGVSAGASLVPGPTVVYSRTNSLKVESAPSVPLDVSDVLISVLKQACNKVSN